jgi:hypothetical protein
MSERPGLGKLTRWGQGAVIAGLVSVAAGVAPVALFLARDWGWGRYAILCGSALLILLAALIDRRCKRQGHGNRIPPQVIEAGHERFTPSGAADPPRGHLDGVRRAGEGGGEAPGAAHLLRAPRGDEAAPR